MLRCWLFQGAVVRFTLEYGRDERHLHSLSATPAPRQMLTENVVVLMYKILFAERHPLSFSAATRLYALLGIVLYGTLLSIVLVSKAHFWQNEAIGLILSSA